MEGLGGYEPMTFEIKDEEDASPWLLKCRAEEDIAYRFQT